MKKFENSCQYCGTPSGTEKYCCEACEKLDIGFSHLQAFKKIDDPQFRYLDLPENQSLYQISKDKRIFKFFIQGVQCSSCVHLLEKIPDYYPDCLQARLNMGTSEFVIELSPKGLLSDVGRLIKELGYEAEIIKSSEDVFEKISADLRSDLKRIALTGACAGNIMLFSVSIYAGAQGSILSVFRWLNFVLFLPVLFYSAIPFYKGAWASLKIKKIHIDLPITVALLISSGLSIFNLLTGSEEYYFDSTASFLFLILIARFFVKKTQQTFLAPNSLKQQIRTQTYASSNGQVLIPENIKTQDIFTVSQEQIIPVDGVLVSERALVDTSFMSGESRPYTFTKGMTLYAGYKVISAATQVQCLHPINETRISQLMSESFNNLVEKSRFVNLADRLSQKLIVIVLLIAIGFFIIYGYFVNAKEGFDRALALIVVACPCALAFGSPLTLAMAFKKARQKGISVRNPNVFEKLNHTQNIFFDKTGTLTDGQLKISYTWPEIVPDNLKSIILQLESVSYHPVAFALRNEWNQVASHLVGIKNITEIFGLGVRGEIGQDLYEIKSLSNNLLDDQTDMAIALYKNKEVLCRIYFEDHIRDESKNIIHYLETQNKNCYLVTGDKKKKAFSIGTACGLTKEHIYSDLYPEDKKEIIEKHPHSLMIGDGVNDSLALSSSEVSIAVKGSAELALTSSDIFFLTSGLNPLIELFSIQKSIHKTLVRNLTLSLIYNIVAGTLALCGFINPLWAAVLMPVSSFVVVLSTVWGFKK